MGNLGEADFGCFGPNGQESGQDYGFTQISPSNDTRIVYVSSSSGDDGNSGLSADRPKRTLAAAYQLLRSGFPDWLLLKRGDTFDGSDWRQRLGRELDGNVESGYTWYKNGRSSSERMVIASYGNSGVRPVVIASNIASATRAGRTGLNITSQKHLMVSGLDFYAAPCDPNSPRFSDVGCAVGIQLYAQAEDVLIEDNRIRYFGSGINVQNAGPNPDQKWNEVVIRRNIIHHNYHPFTHSQGIYTAGAGKLRISQNVMYKNGWNDDMRLALIPAAYDQSAWRSVTNGSLTVSLNGISYSLSGMNFSAVSNYHDVAQVVGQALSQVAPTANVAFTWNGRTFTLRSSLPSTESYGMSAGSVGTNIGAPALLNVFATSQTSNPRHSAATIYNRHMYLAYGYSNATVDGNVTARGASGSIQLRMGGRIVDNLTLAEPVGITVGHAENPAGVPIWSYIADNVVLGAMNISAQPRGFGLGFGGQNFVVERNIVAHNEEGTGNVEGLFSDTDSSTADLLYSNGTIRDNIVYNWRSPTGAGAALALRHRAFSDTFLYNNYFIQPNRGSVVNYSSEAGLVGFGYDVNTMFSAGNPDSVASFSIANQRLSFSEFRAAAGPALEWNNPSFVDPVRTISRYMSDFNLGTQSVDGFMDVALAQSKFSWRPELSAYVVGDYVREGFAIAP
jgi:hypothetical protein